MVQQEEIKKELKDFITTVSKGVQEDPEKAIDTFCSKLAEVITKAILSATITVPVIPVQVAPATGTGATTKPATAKIT